jgi:hypothetical protein
MPDTVLVVVQRIIGGHYRPSRIPKDHLDPKVNERTHKSFCTGNLFFCR